MRKQNRTQKPWQRISAPNLASLQEQIDNRLSRFAQLRFFEHLLKSFTVEKEQKTILGLVPSHYFFGDAVKIALHFRLYYWKQKQYEIAFGVPETAAARIFEWSRELVINLQ